MTQSYEQFSTGTIRRNTFGPKSSVFFNTCFDKGHVKELVSWFLAKYGEKQTINFLELLKYTGFHQATKAGISLGIEDLQIPPEKPDLITEAQIATHKIEQESAAGSLTSVEKSQCLIDTWNQTSDLLRQTAIQNFRNKNNVNPVYMMAFSGARGNISQVRQLVAMRGLMADPQGAILEFPIQSNFREGLTITEYLISCYGARKGLVDTALRTATSGYLTRRLVDSAQHAVIAILDCGTQRGILLQGNNLENRVLGRVLSTSLESSKHPPLLRNQLISITEAKLISKNYNQVFIRSPLTCDATTSVCQFCYGWNLASGKLVQIGEAVGVIAAQSIGEPGTQLTMRTFHTGGVGVFSDQALKSIFSPYIGKVVFNESIPGHFVRTPHGKIVYMVKHTPNNLNRILFRIDPLENIQRECVIREQDLPPGSLLFVKNGERVFAKQLVAQASHVKLTKQRLPESSHPVYSSLDGQIFFESMNLLIEKEVLSSLDETKKTSDTEKYFSSEKNSTLPDVRRMAKIGSFWVFSAYNQQEIHSNTECFIKPGDLVSKNTILYNYLFHSTRQNQLYTLHSKLAFGVQTLQIPIKKVSFNKRAYNLTLATNKNEQLIYKKQTNNSCSLIWYPGISSINENPFNFLYTHISPLYFQLTYNEKGTSQFIAQLGKGNIFRIKQKAIFTISNFTTTGSLSPLVQKFTPLFKKRGGKSLNSSNFVENSLKNLRSVPNNKPNAKKSILLSQLKKAGWLYIPSRASLSQMNILADRQFLPIGSSFDQFCFPKYNVSLKFLTPLKTITKSAKHFLKTVKSRNWYNSANLLDNNFNPRVNIVEKSFTSISSSQPTLIEGLVWYMREKSNFTFFNSSLKVVKNTQNYISLNKLILIQPLQEYTLPHKKQLHKKAILFTSKITSSNQSNVLVSKQSSTLFQLNPGCQFKITAYNSIHSGYFSLKNFLKLQFRFIRNSEYPNVYYQYQTLPNNLSRGLTIFQYSFGTFKDPAKFQFQTYLNNWILPQYSFSTGNVKVRALGECRFTSKKSTGTSISILRNIDCLTFDFTKIDCSIPNDIGKVIRWGDEILPNIGCEHNGQILMKSKKLITLRLGIPILASARGIVHVVQNDLVQKNQLLITLKSRRLQTEDIVQGIPKIEQLFEARESQGGEILSDTVHIRLRNAFVRELENIQSEHWSIAVEKSFIEAQQFLVENIIEAYANQGVKISEIHVEVIVRQMTSRVRILEAGETGLLPGEVVQYTWIQKFNRHISEIGLREATYEPIVLGISKSVLQSESFLLAASFQEVSRVLVRSALSKKRDFLRGLHENVIVGQLIPAGTGLVNQITDSDLLINTSF